MKWWLSGLSVWLLMPMVAWAAPDQQMTIAPVATSGNTILSAEENDRNTDISGTYNTHTHAGYNDYSARAYNTAAIALTSGTATLLTLDSERWDTDTIHSTSSQTSRLTATTAGKYQMTGHVEFAGNTGAGLRRLEILLNGSTVIASEDCAVSDTSDPATTTRCSLATHYNLAATDYVELRARQTVTSSLNITAGSNYSPEFEMVKVP